jgi:hypothetical protein
MTYRKLQKVLSKLSESELDNEIMIYDDSTDKYLPIKSLKIGSDDSDVLDPGHPILNLY